MYQRQYKHFPQDLASKQISDYRQLAQKTKNSSYIEKKYGNLQQDRQQRKDYEIYKNKNDRSDYYSPKFKREDKYPEDFRNSVSVIGSYEETLKPRNRKTTVDYLVNKQRSPRQYAFGQFDGYSSRYQKSPRAKYDLSVSSISTPTAYDYKTKKASYLEENIPQYLSQSNTSKCQQRNLSRSPFRISGKDTYKNDYQKVKYEEYPLNYMDPKVFDKSYSQKLYTSKAGSYERLPYRKVNNFQDSIISTLSKKQVSSCYSTSREYTDKVINHDTMDSVKLRNSYKTTEQRSKKDNHSRIDNRFIKKKNQGSEKSLDKQFNLRSVLSKGKIGRIDSSSKLIEYQNKQVFMQEKETSYYPKDVRSPFRNSKGIIKLSINDFVLGPSKGEGKFGKVYFAKHISTSTIYAIKKISKQILKSHLLQNQLALEIRIQSCLNHPNILKLYGFFDDEQNIYLVLQYMQEGTLFDYLKKRTKKLTQKQVAIKIKEVSSAIKYLHDLDIAHRDIKPENIVISNGFVKLCDFGWATRCNERRKTYCGTFDYAAPQILQGKDYDWCVDLWCLGVLTYQLLTGKVPFYHVSRKQTMKKILRVDRDELVFPPDISPKAKNFVECLMKKNPTQRSNAEQLLSHPFLSDIKDAFSQ